MEDFAALAQQVATVPHPTPISSCFCTFSSHAPLFTAPAMSPFLFRQKKAKKYPPPFRAAFSLAFSDRHDLSTQVESSVIDIIISVSDYETFSVRCNTGIFRAFATGCDEWR
jgi:hypothetical protein